MIHKDFHNKAEALRSEEEYYVTKVIAGIGGAYDWEDKEQPIICIQDKYLGSIDMYVDSVSITPHGLELKGNLRDGYEDRTCMASDVHAGWLCFILDYIEDFENPVPEYKYVCSECGSDDVWKSSWTDPNDDNTFIKSQESGECWCNKCQDIVNLKEVEI